MEKSIEQVINLPCRQRAHAFKEKKTHVAPVEPVCVNNTSDGTVALTDEEHAVQPDITRCEEKTALSPPSRPVTRSSTKLTLVADPVEQMRDDPARDISLLDASMANATSLITHCTDVFIRIQDYTAPLAMMHHNPV